ncbi:MAG TPA: glycosyltransferase family protein [bacterium]
MRVVAVIQARMGSARLPGKVLKDLAGEPMLARVVARTARAARVDGVCVATTLAPQDDPVAALCASRGWTCVRGSEADVLDRYYQAALALRASAVVRVTADCPMIDPGVIDLVVREFRRSGAADYASNILPPRTFPRGLDTEVIAAGALRRAWEEDRDPAWREHVTPYIWRHPERFTLVPVRLGDDHSGHRWTVDTADDLELLRRIYGHFGRDTFEWRDVLEVLAAHPDWSRLNAHVAQKPV